MLTIKFKKLKEGAVLPKYAMPGDAGMDVFSAEDYVLQPGEKHKFSTGIAAEIPEGFFIRFAEKSGLSDKSGIELKAGVVDNEYRGEWMVILKNDGEVLKEFKIGDKLAQAILQKLESAEIVEVQELSDTQRGAGGFGSTGR